MTRRDLVLCVRRPGGAALVYRFDAGELAIGRDPTCAVHLPDAAVSGVHVRVQRTDDGGALAWDAGSRNGTRLGGRAMPAGEPHRLADGDALGVGPFVIEVFFDEGPGLTSSRRDTGRRARALADEAAAARGGDWTVWVVRGEGAGAALPIPPGRGLRLDGGPGSPVRLRGRDGRPVRVTLRLGRDGRPRCRVRGEGVRVRGVAVRGSVPLAPGDHVVVGETILRVRSPASPPATTGWSPLERAALGAVGAALVAAALLMASAW